MAGETRRPNRGGRGLVSSASGTGTLPGAAPHHLHVSRYGRCSRYAHVPPCTCRAPAPDTIDIVPEKTLLAFADHGSLDDRLEPDYAAAERAIAAAADAGIDADALAEQLQRHGAGAFTADWAALLTAIKEKAAKLAQHARGKMDEGSS